MNSRLAILASAVAVLLNAIPAYGNGARPHFAKTDTSLAQAPAAQKPATPRSGTEPAKPGAGAAQKPTPQKPAPQKPVAPGGRWTDIALISVSGGYQAGGSAFSEAFSYERYLERASITTRYPKKDGAAYGGGATFRLWRNLGVGFGVSAMSRSTTGEVNGTVPHPFHFQAGRSVNTTVPLKRSETAVHLSAAYVIHAGRRLLVALGAGPSYFNVKQSLVESVQVDEAYPFDEATLHPPVVTSATRSVWGFNAGADIGYYLTKSIGVGVVVRYAGATLSMASHGASVALKAGGVQAGAGLRLRIPKPAPKKPVKPVKPVKK